jgi:serine/threonine protein kinase
MPGRIRDASDYPVRPGERVAERFTVLLLLGAGGFATVWLVRDEVERHGRYVALRVVSPSEADRSAAAIGRLRRWERDQGSPGVFLVELERVYHLSMHGAYCCQVFPVVGPALSALCKKRFLRYPSFVKGIAQQLARALRTMHSLGVCHGGELFALAMPPRPRR